LAAGTQIDHFVDVNKMAGNGMLRYLAGSFRLGNDHGKVSPFRVAQKMLEVAGKPEFDAALGLLSVGFESVCQRLNQVGFHLVLSVEVELARFTVCWIMAMP